MTNGMKSGAGSDPFPDDSSEEEASDTADAAADETPATNAQPGDNETVARPDSDSADSSGDILPYIFARNSVKTDRRMIQYFLRDETEALETEVKTAVEQELGTDVYLTDIREALVRVGAKHTDEVADELREWGYRYEEDTD